MSVGKIIYVTTTYSASEPAKNVLKWTHTLRRREQPPGTEFKNTLFSTQLLIHRELENPFGEKGNTNLLGPHLLQKVNSDKF